MSGLAEIPASIAPSVDAIAMRLGVPSRHISLAPQQGLINLTVYLGDDLVSNSAQGEIRESSSKRGIGDPLCPGAWSTHRKPHQL